MDGIREMINRIAMLEAYIARLETAYLEEKAGMVEEFGVVVDNVPTHPDPDEYAKASLRRIRRG